MAAPLKGRIGWNYTACSTALTSSELGAERQSTDDLQSLQARIRSITRDMDALDPSCRADTAMGFLTAGDHSSPQPSFLVQSAGRQADPIRITALAEKLAKKGRTSPTAAPEKPVKTATSRFRVLRNRNRKQKAAVHKKAKTPPQVTK